MIPKVLSVRTPLRVKKDYSYIGSVRTNASSEELAAAFEEARFLRVINDEVRDKRRAYLGPGAQNDQTYLAQLREGEAIVDLYGSRGKARTHTAGFAHVIGELVTPLFRKGKSVEMFVEETIKGEAPLF